MYSRRRRQRKKSKTPVASVMSVNVSSKEFRQSTARSTIRERCESIFNQELLSDVNFFVAHPQGGSESKRIPAHKFVLAISSPVFYAMFYGELADKKDWVEISDCEFESVLEMFRFIYSDKANLTPDNVMQLMYLAKKYMLPSLADKCSAYLQDNLHGCNVFQVLPEAQKYEEKDLLDRCWQVIEDETEEAVRSDEFIKTEKSVLEQLIDNGSLNIAEVELFKAVNCWAEKKCENQGLVADGPVKRGILGERIVKGIRFPVMKEHEFADVVLDSDMLTKKETHDLVKYFNSVLKTPLEFCEVFRFGQTEVISRFRSLSSRELPYSPDSSNDIGVYVDRNIKLHAVSLFGSNNGEYSVTLMVQGSNGVSIATETGNYLSRRMHSQVLGGYHGFDVVFASSVALKASQLYSIKATITGPPIFWYGEDGQYNVKHSGVTFTFQGNKGNLHGGFFGSHCSTNVLRGQFCDFRFSID